MIEHRDVVVVGAGLVGLATALHVLRGKPGARVTVLEKENQVTQHQSTHNSGVLHAGLYYRPGSHKARLAVRGIRAMTEFCRANGVAHEICGKLVVATTEDELGRLQMLYERGKANGLTGLRLLSVSEARELEPEIRCVAALLVPEEGIVDYRAVGAAMVGEITARGGEVKTGAGLKAAHRGAAIWHVLTDQHEFEADLVINCAGLHADRVAALMGARCSVRIVPFRGDYYRLRDDRAHLVRNLIYPVPDVRFPFLGVHFTRLVHGGVECGPNAVLALKREGYRRSDLSWRDAVDSLSYAGLWRFMAKHAGMVGAEVVRSFSRRLFAAALRRLVPGLNEMDLIAGGSGVRAQAMHRNGTLVEDFFLHPDRGAVHVLNAPSPAATASLAIGEEIVRLAAGLR
jgi:(S)-2-hydroxyglutarate dehydrogenase